MNLKLSFLVLSLLASLTSFSQQYPEIKEIDGQEVVIMTVEQADEINGLFLSYNDSIKVLNEKVWRLGYDIRFANKQIEALDGTLSEVKIANNVKDNQIAFYKKEVARVNKLEWINHKIRRKVTAGLVGITLSWTAMLLISK